MKIGDKLYKYQDFGRFATYVCTAVITRDKLIQYEMECQSCDHGFKCVILIKKLRRGNTYEFQAMVNDEDEEYKAWHTTYKPHEEFYLTLEKAKISVYENAISHTKQEISKHEGSIESLNGG